MLNGNTWALATELTTQQLGDDVNSLPISERWAGQVLCTPPSKTNMYFLLNTGLFQCLARTTTMYAEEFSIKHGDFPAWDSIVCGVY